jgi:LmbE family N-acetylglucosaminyl deacetylase
MLRLRLGERPGPLRLLCIGAHSDDLEIGCGGTVLRLLEEHPGSAVTWVVLSGDGPRADEARAGARRLLAKAASAQVELEKFKDGYFPTQLSAIKDAFEQLKRLPRPDLILCHSRADAHQDHRAAAELAWNTFRDHLLLEFEIPKYDGDLGQPHFYVPLSRAQADAKVEAILESFPSQRGRAWFKADTFHGLMSLRAVECNAPEGRAEAFFARKLVW